MSLNHLSLFMVVREALTGPIHHLEKCELSRIGSQGTKKATWPNLG